MAKRYRYYEGFDGPLTRSQHAYYTINRRFHSWPVRLLVRFAIFPTLGAGHFGAWLVVVLGLVVIALKYGTLILVVLAALAALAVVWAVVKRQPSASHSEPATWRATDSQIGDSSSDQPTPVAALTAGDRGSDTAHIDASDPGSRFPVVRLVIVAIVTVAAIIAVVTLVPTIGNQIKAVTHSGTPQTLDTGAGVDVGSPSTDSTQSPITTPTVISDPQAVASAVISDIRSKDLGPGGPGTPSLEAIDQVGNNIISSESHNPTFDPTLHISFKNGDNSGNYPEVIVSNGSSTACAQLAPGDASVEALHQDPCW